MSQVRVLALAVWGWGALVAAAAASPSISDAAARDHGLTRAWFTQVDLDAARSRVGHVLLDEGTLFVQTTAAVLHAIDAATGHTLWVQQVGNPDYPSLQPGANACCVGVVNGSTLYVLNRFTGRLLMKADIDGAPGAGPALSQQRAYVPLVSGLVLCWPLKRVEDPIKELGKIDEPAGKTTAPPPPEELARSNLLRLEECKRGPATCQSTGRSLVPPVVLRQNAYEEYAAWTTERGMLFVGRVDRSRPDAFNVCYRRETESPIAAAPVYLPPNPKLPGDQGVVVVASEGGFVEAAQCLDGKPLWRFPTGHPVLEAPVAVGQAVCVTNQLGGMYCLNAKTGAQNWWTPEVTRFVAASKERVYASTKRGQLYILDARSGARLDSLPLKGLVPVTNADTDRVYLVSQTGLVQCFREIAQVEPVVHRTRAMMEAEPPPPEEPKIQRKRPSDDEVTRTPRTMGSTSFPKAKPKKEQDDLGTTKKPAPRARKTRRGAEDALGPQAPMGGGMQGGGMQGGGMQGGGIQGGGAGRGRGQRGGMQGGGMQGGMGGQQF